MLGPPGNGFLRRRTQCPGQQEALFGRSVTPFLEIHTHSSEGGQKFAWAMAPDARYKLLVGDPAVVSGRHPLLRRWFGELAYRQLPLQFTAQRASELNSTELMTQAAEAAGLNVKGERYIDYFVSGSTNGVTQAMGIVLVVRAHGGRWKVMRQLVDRKASLSQALANGGWTVVQRGP